MTVDTSKLKTFEDAVNAIENIDWENSPDTTADMHTIAEWIWKNCDQNDVEVIKIVFIYSAENTKLSITATDKLETWGLIPD